MAASISRDTPERLKSEVYLALPTFSNMRRSSGWNMTIRASSPSSTILPMRKLTTLSSRSVATQRTIITRIMPLMTRALPERTTQLITRYTRKATMTMSSMSAIPMDRMLLHINVAAVFINSISRPPVGRFS